MPILRGLSMRYNLRLDFDDLDGELVNMKQKKALYVKENWF